METEKTLVIKKGSEKNFGFTFSFVFLLISFYLFFAVSFLWVLFFIVSILFSVISIIKPKSFFLLNIIWLKIGLLLARFVNPLIMGFIFFAVVTPIGLLLKLSKMNLFKPKNKNLSTYWIKRDLPLNNMKDQF